MLLPPRKIAAPLVTSTLPAAVSVLVVLPTTALLCVRLFAALRRMPPEVAAARLALPRMMSRAEPTLMAAVPAAIPMLVADRLPLMTMSLPDPVLLSAITPPPTVMPPFSVIPVAAVSVAPVAAVSGPLVMLPVALDRVRAPVAALAPKPPVSISEPAVTPRLPVVAVRLPSMPNEVPALIDTAAPLMASESLLPMLLPPRKIAAPLVTSTLPAAVSVLVVLPTTALLCVRLFAAVRRTPPEVTAARLALPRMMSRPEPMSMPYCVGARPLLVAPRLPESVMSWVPVVARRMVPLVASAPTLNAPRVRVRSRLPVGANTPPVWLKSVDTAIVPLPLKLPVDRLTTPALRMPLATSEPPLTVSMPPNCEVVAGSASVSEPPVMVRLLPAELLSPLTTCAPPASVTSTPATRPRKAISLDVGRASPTQLAASVHCVVPAPPSQQTPVQEPKCVSRNTLPMSAPFTPGATLTVAKLPLAPVPAVRMLKLSPPSVKPLINGALRVPPTTRLPDTASTSCCVPAIGPPISVSMMPPAALVKLPATARMPVLPLPAGRTVPLLVRAPPATDTVPVPSMMPVLMKPPGRLKMAPVAVSMVPACVRLPDTANVPV